MPTRHLPLALLGLVLPAPALAQGADSPRRPDTACAAAEFRQFDFWVGEWEVRTPDGRVAGTNRIEPILGGCALREEWTGRTGSRGTSYNAYDRSRGRWHQTWVDNEGLLLRLDGGLAAGRMRLEGETRDSGGARKLQRITWEPLAGRVRQLWEESADGGRTWRVVFDGRYERVGGGRGSGS
jgi:hypothetical protein